MTREPERPPRSDGDFADLFDAESVAIVGASTDPDELTGRPQHFLEKHGYEGTVYPVNPNHDSIRGVDCYPSVLDVPGEVDVALVLVPSDLIPTVLRECGQKGIRYAVVVGSGFGEVGEEGRELEAELLDIAAEHGVRIVGPNTLGVMGSANNCTLCFSSVLDERSDLVTDGEVALISQSGSFAGMLFLMLQRRGVGTRYWASTGNEIDVDALELMEFALSDPDVSVVVGYIESFADGERFAAVAERALERGVPIVVTKVGQSSGGRRAVSSHTGKMAGEYDVYASVFREYGVIEATDVSTLRDVVATVSVLDEPPTGRCRWAVLSPSGGVGALVADAVDRAGMELATFEETTVETLSEIVPEYGSVRNPVDTTGNVVSQYSLYEDAFTALLDDDNVDVLLLQFGNTGPKMAAAYEDLLTRAVRRTDKTVVAVFTGGKPPADLLERYRSAGIPTFTDPVHTVETVGKIATFGEAVERTRGGRDGVVERGGQPDDGVGCQPDDCGVTTRRLSNWEDASAAMDEYGIPHARGRVVDSAEEAVAAAESFGYPVVVKAAGLAHRTEADAVRVGVDSAAAVERSVAELRESVAAYDPSVELDGVLVQEQVDDGVEVVVGVTETDLGPVLMFGLGGTFVEALDDVAYRTLPVTRATARDLLDETTAGEILSGHRGETYDVEGLIDLMVNAGRLYADADLTELDLNPVKVSRDGAVVVDFLATDS
jgi:acetyltransferase